MPAGAQGLLWRAIGPGQSFWTRSYGTDQCFFMYQRNWTLSPFFLELSSLAPLSYIFHLTFPFLQFALSYRAVSLWHNLNFVQIVLLLLFVLKLVRSIGFLCPKIRCYSISLRTNKFTVLKNPNSPLIRCLTNIRKCPLRSDKIENMKNPKSARIQHV